MAETGPEVDSRMTPGLTWWAVTGASGMIYARELLAYFASRPDLELHAVISEAGEQVLSLELGLTPADLAPGAIWHRVDDFTSPLASGSFRARAMVVIPCSMGTLGAIAQGVGPQPDPPGRRGLSERAAAPDPGGAGDAPEPHPSAESGPGGGSRGHHLPGLPRVLPPAPDLTELARQFAGRILDHLGLEHHLGRRWGE